MPHPSDQPRRSLGVLLGTLLAVIVVALFVTAWLPFVDHPTLWLGLPAVMVWTVAWVVAITVVLAAFEFTRRDPDDADERPERPR